MLPRTLIFTLAGLLACASTAKAGFVISVGDVDLAAGSSGYVPVSIASTAAGQNLASTSFEFLITTAGSTNLQFTDSPDPTSDPTFTSTNPVYVFAGNSLDQSFSVPLGTADPTGTNVPYDTFRGGDATADFSDVVLSAASPFLLADLPVTAATTLPPVPGDVFTISLVPTAGSGLEGNTGFADSNGNYYAFASTPGTVTIAEAPAVPEPATFGMFLLGAVGMFLGNRRHRERTSRNRSGL